MIYAEEEEIESATYKEIDRIIKASKSTLIFTNTRSGTERVVFNLKKRYGYGEDIAAHHSSLSRESRLDVEELLKKGSLKCAVSSTSLELGVDVGRDRERDPARLAEERHQGDAEDRQGGPLLQGDGKGRDDSAQPGRPRGVHSHA